MRRPRSTEGYTLLELAIVVMIMGTMAALVAPGLSEALADSRANGAAEEMVRINRVIRARVNQSGLAHLLLFRASDDVDGSYGLGRVEVWEGMNNRCTQTPWKDTIDGDPADGHMPVEVLDLGTSAYNLPFGGRAPRLDDVGRQVVRLFAGAEETAAMLCFEPGGATYTAAADATVGVIAYKFTPQTEAVRFTVRRSIAQAGEDPLTRGVDRVVLFPAGGNGRMWF